MTGAGILWECIEREGVKDVFGYPGGAILPAYDALKHSKIHHMLVRHEQGATHMADGYARASGKVGVAVATSGPGATNMVTGIATAMLDSSPSFALPARLEASSSAPMPFRKPTSPASRFPSPSTTIWSRMPTKSRAPFARHFTSRGPAGLARCWWISPKMRSRLRANLTGMRRSRNCPAIVRICRPSRRNTSRRWI